MSDELVLAISGNDIFSGGGLHANLHEDVEHPSF